MNDVKDKDIKQSYKVQCRKLNLIKSQTEWKKTRQIELKMMLKAMRLPLTQSQTFCFLHFLFAFWNLIKTISELREKETFATQAKLGTAYKITVNIGEIWYQLKGLSRWMFVRIAVTTNKLHSRAFDHVRTYLHASKTFRWIRKQIDLLKVLQ